jgi:hypothetical protein
MGCCGVFVGGGGITGAAGAAAVGCVAALPVGVIGALSEEAPLPAASANAPATAAFLLGRIVVSSLTHAARRNTIDRTLVTSAFTVDRVLFFEPFARCAIATTHTSLAERSSSGPRKQAVFTAS